MCASAHCVSSESAVDSITTAGRQTDDFALRKNGGRQLGSTQVYHAASCLL